jgi:alkylation response protein AidB-like acyl-CoA dehydrogenase
MYEWSESQQTIREMVRRFVEQEVVPHVQALEHGDLPPYGILRKMYAAFGMSEMARARFRKQIEAEKAGEPRQKKGGGGGDPAARADQAAATLIPIIELCRVCPGMVTAMGVSMGLTAASVMSKGTIAQKERWGRDLLTLEKIGAWAITEPGSGSDAFGSMKATARRDGDEYVLNGSKTFITNGPYADTIVFICKLDEGNAPEDRTVLQFVLDAGMEGLEQSKPLRKMGMHSSPTGELFLDDVRVGIRPAPRRVRGGLQGRTGGRQAPRPPSARSARCGRHGPRHRRTVPRAVGRLRQRPRPVRSAHRRVPAHPD